VVRRTPRGGRLAAPVGRRIVLLAALAAFTGVMAVAWLGGGGELSGSPGTGAPGAARPSGPRAYLVATGIFAAPDPGGAPANYRAAREAAIQAGSPLAFAIWTEQASFETDGWRDVVQIGRVPMNRPPAIDFSREVAVLAWPVAGIAPEAVIRAPGLVLRGTALQHLAVEVQLTPSSGGPAPATPATTGQVLPYALVTILRSQWPIPAPPPTIPPVSVTLMG
jgi:hypothetical protein